MKTRNLVFALLATSCLWGQDPAPVDSPYRAEQPDVPLPSPPQQTPGTTYEHKLGQEERDARFLMDLQVANQVQSAKSADVVRQNQEKASAALMEYYSTLLGKQNVAQAAASNGMPTINPANPYAAYPSVSQQLQQGNILGAGATVGPRGASASLPVAPGAPGAPIADSGKGGGKGLLGDVAGEDGPAVARSKGLGYIPKGTIVDIRLYTRVNTSIPGPVLGEVIFDVWDVDQKWIVIPRGSKLMGAASTMGSDTDSGGKVVFDTFIAPTGREIPIAVPVLTASRIGITGVPGSVDYHWGRVFGGSVALALLTGYTSNSGAPAGANSTMTQGDSVRQNMQSQVNQVGNSLLSRFINIKPDITLEEGTIAKIIILQHMMLKPYQKVY